MELNGETKKFFLVGAVFAGCFFSLLGASCSSLPERAMKVTTTANSADVRYENANNELASGKYDLAKLHFAQAYNLAYSVDDPDLLCRIALSGISYKIITGTLDAQNPGADSFIDSLSATEILAEARYFAERSVRSSVLSAVCSICEVNIELSKGNTNFLIYENHLRNAEKSLAKEPYYLAHAYRSFGDVYIRSKKYGEAVEYYGKAASVHTKNRYLFEIGTDWYGIARAQSLAGKKQDAISAMTTALKYDRDSENSSAIAADYFAIAKILMKGETSVVDRKDAKKNARWAASIFKSIGMKENAAECENFASEIE